MKKLFMLSLALLLCLALLPAAFADEVTFWDRLDSGDVIAKPLNPRKRK